VGVTRIFAVFGAQWMQLQYLIPHQELMTHIDVGDDNSTPEQNMVRADRVELPQAFWALRISPLPMPCDALVSGCGLDYLSPCLGNPELRCCPHSVYNFPAQALA
jgi:hypothetical protein